MKIKIMIISSIVVLVLGFLLGRCSNKREDITTTKQTIKYIPSPYPVYDTIFEPKPYEILKLDTVYLTQDIDTTEILEDYFSSKFYMLDFSNDTIGVFKVNTEVSRNELISAESIIQPKYKTIVQENTVYEVTKIRFYTMIGSSLDFKTNKVSLGIDLKEKYLLGITGLRFDKDFSYTIDFGIKW